MRLNKLKLIGHYKSITGTAEAPFIYTFKQSDGDYSPLCLVGLNGSGKSNFIELIADIFGYADRYFNPQYECAEDLTYDFELEYQIAEGRTTWTVLLQCQNSKLKMFYIEGDSPIFHGDNEQENSNVNLFFELMGGLTEVSSGEHKMLPTNVIAYSSGNNQGLSSVFAKTQFSFFNGVRQQGIFHREYESRLNKLFNHNDIIDESQVEELRDYISRTYNKYGALFEPPIMFNDRIDIDFPLASIKSQLPIGKFTDHAVSQLFFVALMIEDNESFLAFLAEHIKISSLESFEIDLRLSDYRYLDFIRVEAERLRDLSTDSSRFNSDTLNGILRFEINEHFYERLDRLYLERTMFLGNLFFINQMVAKRWSLDEKRTLKTSRYERNVPNIAGGLAPIRFINTKVKLINVEDVTLYDRLSDGEHQLIQIIGSLILFGSQQSLFILDEPESHFNPEWRIDFIDIIIKYIDLSNAELIVSTHSPFVLSACKSERVLHFKKNSGRSVGIEPLTRKETYGASFDSLLTSIFDLDVLISTRPLNEIREILLKYDRQQLSNIETLNKLDKFGQSFELNYRRNKIRRTLTEHEPSEDN